MTLYPKPVLRRKWMFMLRNCCFSRSECWTQPELSRASHILDGRAPGVGGCGLRAEHSRVLGIKQCVFYRNGFFLVERAENLETEDCGSSPSLALESEWCLLRCSVCSLISSFIHNNLVNKVLPPPLLCGEEAGLHRWPHGGCPASVTPVVTSSASPTLTLTPPT